MTSKGIGKRKENISRFLYRYAAILKMQEVIWKYSKQGFVHAKVPLVPTDNELRKIPLQNILVTSHS